MDRRQQKSSRTKGVEFDSLLVMMLGLFIGGTLGTMLIVLGLLDMLGLFL